MASRNLLSRLWRQRAGVVAIVLALAAAPLTGAAGVAIDAACAYFVKLRLQSAADAAALAGGRVLASKPAAAVIADVDMFFHANFPDGLLGSTAGDPQVTIAPDLSTLSVDVTAALPTTLGRLLGLNALDIAVSNTVQRTTRGMELALVLDNTGSMGVGPGSKMEALKAAAANLVDILMGDNETRPNFWVSLVPYTTTVNIGTQHRNWLDPADFAAKDYRPSAWRGCVEARPQPYGEVDDTPPVAEPGDSPADVPLKRWKSLFYASTLGLFGARKGDNDWQPGPNGNVFEPNRNPQGDDNNIWGPNVGCPPALHELTASKSTMLAAIAGMNAYDRGGTMANLGLVWGWRTLSPRWQGLWGGTVPDGSPLAYNTPYMDKVVILLTDGQNQWYDWPGGLPGLPGNDGNADYTGYGRLLEGRIGTTDMAAATATINQLMLAACSAMKRQGIIVYTITFEVTDPATQELYTSCASQPNYYFNSPSVDALAAIFQQIGSQLSNLRLVK